MTGRPLRLDLLAVLALGLLGCDKGEQGGPKGGGKGQGDRPVAVILGQAARRDVPIWLEGLASVSAWQQVTVRPQVDGRLEQVFFKEGQTVKKGDVLAQIDPRPFQVQLHQAEGALVRDRTQSQNARVNLERYKTLRGDKLISQQQVDDQEALLAQAEGAVKIDEAGIESARLNLDYARVRAPIAGVVGIRLVDVGNLVRATDPTGLVVLTQIDPIAVFVTLPQDELPAIAQAMARGEVPVEILPRDGTTPLAAGRALAIDNQINAATATVRVKVEVPNPRRTLWPNQFVKARLLVDTARQAVVVPAAAVQRGPQGSFVYLADAEHKARQQPVEVLRTVDEQALLKAELPAEARVVVEGQGQLRPGATIVAREAGSTPAPGAPDGKPRP